METLGNILLVEDDPNDAGETRIFPMSETKGNASP
jgi:hypothetical protein